METSRDLQAESPNNPTMCSDEGAEAQVQWTPETHQHERLGPRGTGGDTGEGSRHNVLKEMSWELAGEALSELDSGSGASRWCQQVLTGCSVQGGDSEDSPSLRWGHLGKGWCGLE